MSITQHGQPHLCSLVGTPSFVCQFVVTKVSGWVCEIEKLSKIAALHHHCAYSAFVHGFSSKWNYLFRTLPNISDLLIPLERIIHHVYIPALTGCCTSNRQGHSLLAFPLHLVLVLVLSNGQYTIKQATMIKN